MQFGSDDSSLVPSNGIPYKGAITIKIEDGTVPKMKDSDKDEETTDGTVIGIIVGVVIGVIAILAVVACFCMCRGSKAGGPPNITGQVNQPSAPPMVQVTRQSAPAVVQVNQQSRSLPRATELTSITSSNQAPRNGVNPRAPIPVVQGVAL